MTFPGTSEAAAAESLPEQKCPQCGQPLPVAPGFALWCRACEWGLAEPEERKGIFRRRADRWSARQVESLFRQVSGSRAGRPGWGLARVVSYAIAICVLALCPAFVALGAWLLIAMPNIVTIILAVCALLLGVELRPRLGSWRKLGPVRYRKDAPVLFGVLDQIAAAVGAKPVHGVVPDARWNASYMAVGWRRRRAVSLGLPLWDSLSADQRVAVLGHEFAHGVNGDARHGVIVGSSRSTLIRLHAVLRPGPRDWRLAHMSGSSLGALPLAEDFARLLQALVSGIVAGVLTLQQLISLRASQRAEYLADTIAARIASPASMEGALDTIVTGESTCSFVRGRRGFRGKEPDFWEQLRSALTDLPESEKERRRRESARKRLQVTTTHPPTHLRVAMLGDLPGGEPLVTLSAAQEEQIRAELAADYTRIGREIDTAAAR